MKTLRTNPPKNPRILNIDRYRRLQSERAVVPESKSEHRRRSHLRGRYGFAGSFLCLAVVLIHTEWLFGPGLMRASVGWLQLDLIVVGVAYLWRKPGFYGKTTAGSLRPWSVALFLPLLFATWLVWRLQVARLREAIWNELAPGIYVGRRCRRDQLPPSVAKVIDCTAEFPTDRETRQTLDVLCLPTLDGCPPTWADCERALDFADRLPSAPVYIFCAQGHGRSVTLAALLLLKRGLASTPEAAFAAIKSRRPHASLNCEQWQFLNEASRQIAATKSSAAPVRESLSA